MIFPILAAALWILRSVVVLLFPILAISQQ